MFQKNKAVYITDLEESTKKDSIPFSKASLNTGNLLFHKAISKTTGLKILPYWYLGHADLSEYDTVVTSSFVCVRKTEIFPHWYNFHKKYGDKVKIVPLGVGIQDPGVKPMQFTKETEWFLKSISERVTLACRGEYTVDALAKIGVKNTTVLGCPSLFYNENPEFQIAVNDYPTNPRIAANATLVTTDKITKEELKKFVLFCRNNKTEFIEQSLFNGFRLNIEPDLWQGRYVDWLWQRKFFFEINPWIKYMRKFDFTIGGRFHGSVVGLLANVPALVLDYDIRVTGMANYFNIPVMSFKNFDETKDPRYYYEKMDYSAFNKGYKEKYNKYFNYLKENGIYGK